MSTEIQLNPRLYTAASLVRDDARLADIGTDHAYLPIALLQQGKVSSAIAADLREGPLTSARNNAIRCGVSERLVLRCCNGLTGIAPEEVDDIVIAGMGGELIASILNASPWVKDSQKRLILQPMSSAEDLRHYLRINSFYIDREIAVEDNNHVYTVMQVRYCESEQNEAYPGCDYLGELDPTNSTEAMQYAERQLRHLSKILIGQQYREAPETHQTIQAIREIARRMGGHPVVFTGDIYDELDRFAPFHSAMDFDNPGLLVGGRDYIVKKALLALDITPAVIQEAVEQGTELIISHHPVIFNPIKTLSDVHPAYLLAKHKITAICAHTNLDLADGGVNTCLTERIGLTDCKPFVFYNDQAEALIGSLPQPMEPEKFAQMVREQLNCSHVQWVPGKTQIKKVGVCGGSAGELIQDALKAGADAYVTGEVRHHQLLEAEASGITLVVAGHYATEHIVLNAVKKRLAQVFPQVEFIVSVRGTDPAQYV